MYPFYEYEYIVPMDDLYVKPILYEPMLRSIEFKSKCTITINRRVLNRRAGTTTWSKYAIIKIQGPSESSVIKCNKLMEDVIPFYIYRREYDNQVSPTLYTTEFFPDNTNLIYAFQRLGATQDTYQGLQLHSGHSKKHRYPNSIGTDLTPWKIFIPQKKGIHYPSQLESEKFVNYYHHNIYSTQKPISHRAVRYIQTLNKKSCKDVKRVKEELIPKKLIKNPVEYQQKITDITVSVTRTSSITNMEIEANIETSTVRNNVSPKNKTANVKNNVSPKTKTANVRNVSPKSKTANVRNVSLKTKTANVRNVSPKIPAAKDRKKVNPKIQAANVQNDLSPKIQAAYVRNNLSPKTPATNAQNDVSPKIQKNPFKNDIKSSEDFDFTKKSNASNDDFDFTKKKNASSDDFDFTKKNIASSDDFDFTKKNNASYDDFDFTKKNNASYDDFDFTKKNNVSSQEFDISNEFNISYKETTIKKDVHATFEKPSSSKTSPGKTKTIVVEGTSIIEYDENITPRISLYSEGTTKASNSSTQGIDYERMYT